MTPSERATTSQLLKYANKSTPFATKHCSTTLTNFMNIGGANDNPLESQKLPVLRMDRHGPISILEVHGRQPQARLKMETNLGSSLHLKLVCHCKLGKGAEIKHYPVDWRVPLVPERDRRRKPALKPVRQSCPTTKLEDTSSGTMTPL